MPTNICATACRKPSAEPFSRRFTRYAGRTPLSMLRFVLRDGFEQCEDDLQAARIAEAEIARSGTVPHQQVMNEARATIVRHARAQRHQAA